MIQRSTYSLAGQAIAVRVSGDPNGNNGLYYVHTDHLGSVHILTRHSDGYVEAGSLARYAPFGAWRTEPTTNPALSGRGYTGHRHNNTGANDLGLIYMGARFYVPSIGRFASADTIVPEPDNPQSFNRFSYTLNNPVRYTDPTGHVCYDPGLDAALPGNCNGGTVPVQTPPQPASSRTPIEVNDWEKQLLTISAFVEMHGHGEAQAKAITWVTLNRVAGKPSIAGGFFAPNRNFRESSPVGNYVLSLGQFAISEVLANEYGLLVMGAHGNWQPVNGMSIEEVIAEGYERLNDFYDGAVDSHMLWIDETIKDYNSGATDPTGGAVWYGHITPDKVDALVTNLQNYAESLGLANQFTYQIFDSERPNNPISLIVNNLTYAP